MRRALLPLLLCALASPAAAMQTLIPSPYPVTVPGAQPLDPEPMPLGGPQQLMRDPYPQILGDDAQGNPPIARRMRHQRLIPSIYQRKYKVDRPVRSGTP
jgi:hypothetical protein